MNLLVMHCIINRPEVGSGFEQTSEEVGHWPYLNHGKQSDKFCYKVTRSGAKTIVLILIVLGYF